MTEISQPQQNVSATTVLSLVEALYAYADKPEDWNDIISALEALPGPLDPQRDPAARTIMNHAARAAALLDHLNDARLGRMEEAEQWDAVLLSSEALVRGTVGIIAERLRPFLETPVQAGHRLAFSKGTTNTFDNALESVMSVPETRMAPFKLGSVQDPSRCFCVILPRDDFPAGLVSALGVSPVWTEALFAIVLLSAKDGDAEENFLNTNLGLTSAESKLAARLLQGFAINHAARDLGMSDPTARWHIKNIYAKTGAQRQPELLRLLREATTFPSGAPQTETTPLPEGTPARRFVTLPDGRRLFYREYGVRYGTPVVYFHFGLCASMLPPAAALAATKTGVRVISFERPGFGQSDPRANYTFDGVAEDAEDLCRLLNLRNVGLFGDGYGGGFAVATALRLGTAVRRLALHAPNLGRRIEPTSQPTGVSVFSRQLWIVPLAAEILRKGLRNSVVRSLMSYVAERSRKDAARMNDRKFDDYLVSAVFDALEKTSVGLAAETVMFGKGLRVEAANIKRPISVWHGAENSIVPLSNSIAEFTNHPFAKLNVFSDAGLFLGQREFEEIFSWMATAPSQGHVKIGEQIHPLA